MNFLCQFIYNLYDKLYFVHFCFKINKIKTLAYGALPDWWVALRPSAFVTNLSLKGSLNAHPYAPHPRTDYLGISYCFLFYFVLLLMYNIHRISIILLFILL